MTLRPRRRIRRSARGGYVINLPPDERSLLKVLPAQLIGSIEAITIDSGELPPPLRRLFPVAHPRDGVAEFEYALRHRSELVAQHLDALVTLAQTADSTRLDEAELEGWLGALNELRLALGTALGVTEEQHDPDPDAPDFADWVCYHYLSYLQSEVIDVLAEALPDPVPGAGDDLPEDPWGDPLGGLRWDGTPSPEQPG